MRPVHLSLFYAAFLMLSLLSGCSLETSSVPDVEQQKNSASAKITWADETVVFDKNDTEDLLETDEINGVFSFNTSSSKAASLKGGDIIVLEDIGVFRVRYIDNDESKIKIETEPASLTDAAKNAEFLWNYEITFPPSLINNFASIPGINIIYMQADSLAYSCSSDGLIYNVGMRFLIDRLNINIETVPVNDNDNYAKFSMIASIGKINTNGEIRISDFALTKFKVNNNFREVRSILSFIIDGKLVLSGGPEKLAILPRYKIPNLPYFTFELSSAPQLSANFPTAVSCNLLSDIMYSSNLDLQYTNGEENMIPGYNLYRLEPGSSSLCEINGDTGDSGFEWGTPMPSMGVSFGGLQAATYSPGCYLKYEGHNSAGQCSKAAIISRGTSAWSLLKLGQPALQGSAELWNKDKVVYKKGNCP